jgi:hypothetical protein
VAQSGLFVPLTRDLQLATRQVLLEHQRMLGRGGGRNGADPFVVALARLHGGTVVTEETMSNNLSKPRIPDVCQALGVPWLDLVGFVQCQGWSFDCERQWFKTGSR